MIRVRRMSLDDLAVGLRLKDQARWNQTADDWQRVLHMEPEGCFVAEFNDRPVGTAVTTLFGNVAWIAMVLVDEAFRRRGIATRLMQHCLTRLDAQAVPTARLDATPLGRPLYEKLGFQPEYELMRFEMRATGQGRVPRTTPLDGSQLPDAIRLDRRVTGTDRSRLLERLLEEQPQSIFGLFHNGELLGYHASRAGSRATQIGPAIAADAATGAALLDEALARCPPGMVFIDIPLDNQAARNWAEAHGLSVQRYLTRMRRGLPVDDQPPHIWASFGPEKG